MAASAIAVANAALLKLGQGTITAFSDEDEKARWLNARFAPLRDALLRSYRWTFAMARASLSADVDAPAFDYDLAYTLPGDCLQLVEVVDGYRTLGLADYIGRDVTVYTVEGRKVLANISAPLKIRYVTRQEDTTLWDPLFDEALANRLAYDLCEKVTQSGTKREAAYRDYRDTIREAIRVNAVELPSEQGVDGSWLMGRL